MIQLSRCNKLIDVGFSLLTVSENKVPNFLWGANQEKALNKQEFGVRYNHQGGITSAITKDGEEVSKFVSKTQNVGIITGYDYLEVIDVDLKVFNTAKEQIEFWEEYISFLEDSILDFREKVVIYKTKNAGYHILYKTKKVKGNTKIASLKGHNEAVIETRGKGGYVFCYDEKNVGSRSYVDIGFISDSDRKQIWEISQSYNYVEDKKIEIPTKVTTAFSSEGLKCWDDYNQKTSALDLISFEFDVVRNLKDKFIIRRRGAKSPHSGYVFKQDNKMYLYSTGTSYIAEKQYSPFDIYAHQKHNNDFSAAASDLYEQGYGDRIKLEPIFVEEKIEIPKADLIFPIEIFPESIQNYILISNKTLSNSIDYMGSAMLFVGSIIIGNSLVIEIKNGWTETANLWLALVGKAGIGKTPSISSITFPLDKVNNREIKRYIRDYEKHEAYKNLDEKDKKLTEDVKKPKKSQFIVNDITLEALIDLHYENKNGIGVNKDELAGWFKDMNKYRQGSDLEHWLSSWSGKQININRKTAKSSFVQRAFIPVLGGIQPSILDNFYTEENKESGFLDRMLFCYPDMNISRYSDDDMDKEHLDWYENTIIGLYDSFKSLINYNADNEIEPYVCSFTPEAKDEYKRIHHNLSDLQESPMENEYMKSMLPKQKSYVLRFSLIINTLASITDNRELTIIQKDSVLKAEKLSNYFIAMAKKIKGSSKERNDMKSLMAGKISNYDKFKSAYSKNKNLKKTDLAELLGVSRKTIYKYIKEYDKK